MAVHQWQHSSLGLHAAGCTGKLGSYTEGMTLLTDDMECLGWSPSYFPVEPISLLSGLSVSYYLVALCPSTPLGVQQFLSKLS